MLNQIEKCLDSIRSSFEESELLLVSERRTGVTLREDEAPYRRSVASESVMATAITDQKLGRVSWVGNRAIDFTSRINPAVIANALRIGDTLTYRLNRSMALPVDLKLNPNVSVLADAELESTAREHANRLDRKWKNTSVTIQILQESVESCFANSHGVRGSYLRHVQSASIVLRSRTTGKVTLVSTSKLDDVELEKKLEQVVPQIHELLPTATIRRGTLSVILSPKVVETICRLLVNHTRLDASKQTDNSFNIPESFELTDDPTLPLGYLSTPFDDEGTLTCRKVLFEGQRLRARISDLFTSARYSQRSSGNGFRTSPFGEKPSEIAPIPQPTNLLLKPGKLSISEVIASHDRVLLVSDVLVPFNQLSAHEALTRKITYLGRLYRYGKATNYIRGERSPIQGDTLNREPDYLGFLNRSAIILRDGLSTRLGWFPHILIPEARW